MKRLATLIFLAIALALCWGVAQRSVWLRWDYPTTEPVTFEVWMATNLSGTQFIGKNVPAGFWLLTNTEDHAVEIPAGQAQAFFIVRARDSEGYSDWGTR